MSVSTAHDEQTGEQAYKPVLQLFQNTTKEWYHVHVNGEEIICTGGHPFYVVNAEANRLKVNYGGRPENANGVWICANQLQIGDKVLLSNGNSAIIESVEVEKLSEPETTYNFEVADFHTYYVSDSKVLVHNMCAHDNILANVKYTEKVKLQMTQDINHGFPTMIDDIVGTYGKVGNIVGGDGIKRTVVELPGAINGNSGIFQYIIESDGITVNHRFFESLHKSLLGG